MINLLPKKEKEELFLGAVRKLVVIFGIMSAVLCICILLSELAVKFYILSESVTQKFLLQEAEKKYQSPEVVSLKDIMQEYNKKIPLAVSFYEKELFLGNALAEISSIERPKGTKFNSISLSAKNYEDGVKAVVSGASLSREDLLLFQKEIEKYPEIKNIYFSPESWINPGKSNFVLTFQFYENRD